jgi:hypothetical protein
MSLIDRRAGLAAVAGLLLAGCATEQGQMESSTVAAPPVAVASAPAAAPAMGATIPGAGTLIPPVVPPPVLNRYPHTIQDAGTGAAAMSLYRKAQDALAAGHPDQAEALLERAQRIEPRNPFLWQALAGTKLKLNQPDQAEEFANRSNDLARGNPYVETGNWRVIATARQMRGNANGAVQAQNRAEEISRIISP